jgi:DNA-3-methyladenine glycosylase II
MGLTLNGRVDHPNLHPGLTETSFAQGLLYLSEHDPDLAQVVSDLGPPPMWRREPGFPTLVRIILEQQVSLASARAAFDRLVTATSPLTPERFLQLDDVSLKTIGYSRQKMGYTRNLAELILEGRLDLDGLSVIDDRQARTVLLQVKGIGAWTADIYLLMALLRPDVWPSGDLALASAVQVVKRLPQRPSPDQLDGIGLAWRPWRAVAARILWHYYLSGGVPKPRLA